MQTVLEGPEVALLGVPWGQFGNLLTVDRQENREFTAASATWWLNMPGKNR